MERLPLVSCLTVTEGRADLLARSLACYERQTYPNRELVIVSQAEPDAAGPLRQLVRDRHDPAIQLHEVSPDMPLGAMRNVAIELSHGEVLCQWDDDDLSHPLRVARQYQALLGDGVVVAAYQQHLKWFEDTDELYWIDWGIEGVEDRRYLHGTAMFRRESFVRLGNLLYPEEGPGSEREEDWHGIRRLLSLGRIAGLTAGEEYIYTYHGRNTYWRAHHELVLQKRVLDVTQLNELRPKLERALRACGVGRPVIVRGLQEVAFVYRP